MEERQQMDWNAKLVKFFYDRSRLVWLIIIGLMIGGVASLMSLRSEGFPAVTPKIVFVQTIYPGAPAEEVESNVTKPIEAAIKDVKDLKEFSSTSQNSFSNVIITLNESSNLDRTVGDIQNRVQSARADLPKDVEQPKVSTFTTSGPAFFLGVAGLSDSMALRSQTKIIAEEISAVEGVKAAKVANEHKGEILVKYRAAELTKNGVSLATLSQVFQAANVSMPVGTLTLDNTKQSVVSKGSFEKMEEIAAMVVGVNPATGRPVKLSDIADIEESTGGSSAIERFGSIVDGKLAVREGGFVNVTVNETADIIEVDEAIKARLAKIKDDGVISRDLEVVALYDQSKFTKDQIGEIVKGAIGSKENLWLLGGLQLLFIAMLLLVNYRSALIATLAIPFSLALTFISLALTGTQLNTIVLFSLILVLGLIVDPAIVMIEAIQRYRDLGRPSHDAVLLSGRRYGASIFMAVLTSALVFLPFGVVSGFFGEIIRYIPLTVIPALVASYFVPIALLPLLSRRLVKPSVNGKSGTTNEEEGLSKPARFVMSVNRWVLGRPWRQISVLAISIILVILSGLLVATGQVQIVQFAKPEDNQMYQIEGKYKKGLTFEQKDQAHKGIEAALVQQDAINTFYFMDQDSENFILFGDLKPKAERKNEADKSKMVVARLQDKLSAMDNFSDILVTEVGVGTPQASFQIQTQLSDTNLEKLEKAAKEVGYYLTGLEHVVKVDDGFTGREDPTVEIALDRIAVERAGLSSFEIATQLKSVLDKTKIAKFENGQTGEREDIVLVNSSQINKVSELESLPIISRSGAMVTLGSVADVRAVGAVDSIAHYNGDRYVTIKARVDDTKNVAAIQSKLDEFLSPDKLAEWGINKQVNRGEMADISKSFTELGVALVIAIVLTYIFLVLQFGSFSLPGIMLFTVPLSFIGVFPALYLAGTDLGFLELLGVTILVGIVENVAIFLVDYANQLRREKSVSAKEAIIAASGVRFRPILLTKLVALGGLLPLAIESEMWRGLSVVIIAGIGLSGFFSLVAIPVLYVWIENVRRKLKRQEVSV